MHLVCVGYSVKITFLSFFFFYISCSFKNVIKECFLIGRLSVYKCIVLSIMEMYNPQVVIAAKCLETEAHCNFSIVRISYHCTLKYLETNYFGWVRGLNSTSADHS